MQDIHIGMMMIKSEVQQVIPYGLVVRMPASHVGGPGSIPGVGTNLLNNFSLLRDTFEKTQRKNTNIV